MILKLIEIVSRYYYKVCNQIDTYSFVEKKITPINEKPLFFLYYFYIFCFYFEKLCKININTNYKKLVNYYEVIYTDNNIKRATIINGTINDIFEYTRYNKCNDKPSFIFKYNYIVNDVKTNIRSIIKKYDTKTKLYDVIYFNFYNDITKKRTQNDQENNDKLIEVEIGNNIYNINEMNKDLLIEDA